jgi:ribosome recycling factor
MSKQANFSNNLKDCVEWLKKELKQISAGQANPAVLDSVNVESYGSFMPIAHVANISLDGNALKVSPWDKSQIKVVEQAIRDADMGVSLVTESDGVRVIFPQLTSETRTKFVKQAKEKLEEARIKVKQFRQDVMDEVEDEKKEGGISEDDARRTKDQLQKQVESTNNELEEIFKTKEGAILKV